MVFTTSMDGTCTGDIVVARTIVRALDGGAASARCDELGLGIVQTGTLNESGYSAAPADFWVC